MAITEKLDTERKGLEIWINEKHGLMHDLLTGKVEVKIDQPKAASF